MKLYKRVSLSALFMKIINYLLLQETFKMRLIWPCSAWLFFIFYSFFCQRRADSKEINKNYVKKILQNLGCWKAIIREKTWFYWKLWNKKKHKWKKQHKKEQRNHKKIPSFYARSPCVKQQHKNHFNINFFWWKWEKIRKTWFSFTLTICVVNSSFFCGWRKSF